MKTHAPCPDPVRRWYSPHRSRVQLLVVALLISPFVGACGGDKGKTSHTADDITQTNDAKPSDEAAPEPSIRPLEDNPDAAVGNSGNQHSSAKDDEYFVTYSDCNALADAYGRAWQNDEMAKLNNKNLKPAQQKNAAANIGRGAEEARADWHGQCQNIVDSAMLHSRLACAAKAKTMQRFNDCWDGKVDGAGGT